MQQLAGQPAGLTSQSNDSLQASPEDVPDPSEDERSILRKTGDAALDTVGGVGNFLDIPASVGRDLLTLLPGGPAPANPFDQLLPTNWTKSENRTSGIELLEGYGLIDKDAHPAAKFAAGLTFEVLTDPLTYFSAGGTAALKGGTKGAMAARSLKKTGLLDNVDLFAKGGKMGRRQALLKSSADDVLGSDLLTKAANKPGEADEILSRVNKEFEEALRSDKSFKKATKGMSDSQVSEFIEQVRGSALSQGYMRMGAFGKGFNFGDRFAPAVDSALGKIRYSRPVVDAAARMSKAYEGKTTAESQKAVRKFMLEQQGAFTNARGKMYENIRVLDPLLNSFSDLKGDDLVNAKNEVGLHMVRYLEDIGRPRMDVDMGEGLTGKASEFFDSRDEMFSQSRSDYRDSFLRDLEERVASDAPENSLVTQDIYDRVKAALSPVDEKKSVLDDIKDQLDGLIVESRRFQDISQLQDEFATYFPRQRQTSRGILTGSKGSGAKAFDPENPFSIKREDKYRNIDGGTEALNRMSIDPQFAGIYSKRALNATKPNAEEKAAKLRKFASKYFSLDIAEGDTPPKDVVELFGSITQRDLFDVQRGVTMFSTNPAESALKAIETAYKARAQAEMMRSVVRDTMEVVPTPSGRFNTGVRTTFGVGAESEESIKASNVLGRKLGAALRTGEEAVSSKFKFGKPDDGPGGSGRGAGVDPDGGSGGGSGQTPDGGSGLDNLDTADSPAVDPVPATGALTDEEFKEASILFERLPDMSDEEAFGYESLVRRMLDGDGADRELAEKILGQRPDILDESLRRTDDADVNFNTAVQVSENMEQMGDEIFQYEDLFKTLMDGDAADREIVGTILSRMLDADEESAAFADRVLGSRTDILDVSSVARGDIADEVGDVVTDAVDDVADEASEGLPYNPLLDGDRDEIIRLLASDQAEESLSGLNRESLRRVSAASGLGIKSNSSDKLRRGLIDAARKASKEADAPAPTMSAMSVAEIAGTQDRNAGNLLTATGLFRGKVDDSGYTVFLPDEVKAQMTEGDEPLVLTRGLNEAQSSGADQQVRDLIRKLSNNPRPATELSSDADTGKLVFRSDDSKTVAVPSRIVETIRLYHPEAEFFVTDYVRGAGDRRPHVVARVGEDFVGNIEADLLQSSAKGKADSIKASARSDFPKSMSSASAGKIAESAIRKYLRSIPADRADSLQRSDGKVGSVLGRIKSMISQVAKAKQWERSTDVFGTGERSMSEEATELVNQGIFDIAWDKNGQTYLAIAGRKNPEWLTLTDTDRARMALPNPPGVETVKRFGGNRILNADYEEAARLIDSLPDVSDEVSQSAKVGAIPLSRINHEVDDVRDSLFEYLFEKSPTRFRALQESLMKQGGDSAKRMLLSMEKVSSPAIQSDSLAGVASKVTVDAPHRTRVVKQMSNVFGEEVAAAALSVTDATARAWARGTGKSADEYYAGIKEVVSVDEVTVRGEVLDVRGKIAFDRKTGEAIITGRKDADASTAFHELAHYAQRKLGEIDPELQLIANRAVGAKSSNWTVPQMEEFAEGFEKFLSEGVAPTPELEGVYKKVKQWIIDVYRGLAGTPLENKISDDLREVYIRMQGGKLDVDELRAREAIRRIESRRLRKPNELTFEAEQIVEGGLEGMLSGRLARFLIFHGMKKDREVTEQVNKLLEGADDNTLEGIAKARVGFRLGLKPNSSVEDAFSASGIRSQAEYILGKRKEQGGKVERGIEMPSMPNSAARDGDQLGLIDGEGSRSKARNTIKGKGEASQVNLIGGLDQDPNQTSFLEELDGTVKESAFDDAPAVKPKPKRYRERTPDEKQRIADSIGVSRQKLASAGWKKKGKRQAKGKRFIQAEIESVLEEARDTLAESEQGGMMSAILSQTVEKAGPYINKLVNQIRQRHEKGSDHGGLRLDVLAREMSSFSEGASVFEEQEVADFLMSLPVVKRRRGNATAFYLDTSTYSLDPNTIDLYDPRVVKQAKEMGLLEQDKLFPKETIDSLDFPSNVDDVDDIAFQSAKRPAPVSGRDWSSFEVDENYSQAGFSAVAPQVDLNDRQAELLSSMRSTGVTSDYVKSLYDETPDSALAEALDADSVNMQDVEALRNKFYADTQEYLNGEGVRGQVVLYRGDNIDRGAGDLLSFTTDENTAKFFAGNNTTGRTKGRVTRYVVDASKIRYASNMDVGTFSENEFLILARDARASNAAPSPGTGLSVAEAKSLRESQQATFAASKDPKLRSQFDWWVLTKQQGDHNLSFEAWLKDNASDEYADFRSIGEIKNSEWIRENGVPSEDLVRNAVKRDQVEKVQDLRNFADGKPKFLRIDIPAYSSTGQYVVTLHQKRPPSGAAGYSGYGRLQGKVDLLSKEKDAQLIGTGAKAKFPLASVKGVVYEGDDYASIPKDIDDWTPVGYNPKKVPFFYDKRTGDEVISGEDAISVGNTVYVRKVTKRGKRNANLSPAGEYEYKRSNSKHFKRWFKDSPLTVEKKGPTRTVPQVLFHAAPGKSSALRIEDGPLGRGVYITSNQSEAAARASELGDSAEVMDLYASIQNPLVVSSADEVQDFVKTSSGEFDSPTDAIRAAGYDGVILEQATDDATGEVSRQVVAFDRGQVKSVTNQGTFDRTSDDVLFQSGRGRTPEPPIVNEAGETVAEVSMPGRPFMRSPGKVFIEATNQATGEDFARVLGSVYSDHIADIDPALETRAEVLYGVVNGDWDTPFTRGTETKTSREWLSEDFAKYARGEIKPPTGLGAYMDGMLSMTKGLIAGRKTEPSSNELSKFFGELMTEPFRGELVTLRSVMDNLKHTGDVAKSRMLAMMTPDEIRQASRNALRLRVESRRASAPKSIAEAEQKILDKREILGGLEPDSEEAAAVLAQIKNHERSIKDLENLQAKTVDQWMEEAEQVAFEGRNSLDGVSLEVKPESLLGQVRIPTHIARDLYKLNETASYLEDDFAIGPFLKWYDGYSSVFKTGVTALHPGFHVRNFFSGWAQNALNDVHDPRYGPADPRRLYGGYPDARQLMYGKTFKEANQIEGLRTMTDEEASEQIAKELFVHGVVEQPGTYRDIPGEGAGSLSSQLLGPRPGVAESKNMLDFVRKRSPGSSGVMDSAKADNTVGRRAIDGISDAWKRVSETGRTVGDAVEFQHRAGGFIMLRRQGYSAAEAARRINLLHVDYSNLSTFEKEYLRRIIPFYSFSRGMAKYLTEELITRPAGPVGITIRAQNQARDRDVATPTYVSKGLSIPIGATDDGTRTFITGLGLMHEQPVQQIAPLLSLNPARTAFAAISNMNPVIKAPLELAFDESSFQEGVSGGVDLDDARPPVGQMLSNLMDKESGQPVRLGKTFEVMAGSSPLSRYIKTVSQMSDDRKGIMGRYVAPLTGLRVTSVSPERQDAVLRERAEGYLQSIGARKFEKRYIPDDVYESMSPEDKEIADKYMRVIDRIGDRNKASRKAKSKEEKKGLVDGK